jgi:hypothetical protein
MKSPLLWLLEFHLQMHPMLATKLPQKDQVGATQQTVLLTMRRVDQWIMVVELNGGLGYWQVLVVRLSFCAVSASSEEGVVEVVLQHQQIHRVA